MGWEGARAEEGGSGSVRGGRGGGGERWRSGGIGQMEVKDFRRDNA